MSFIRTKRHRKTDSGWILQSEWTHSTSVEFDDGKNLKEKMESHPQNASDIQAGTFAGQVKVPSSTKYTENTVRNIVFLSSDADPGEGVSSSYGNGSLICVYE